MNGASGKAFSGDDLKSGELLVWIYKMILTVDRKHIIFYCFVNQTIVSAEDMVVFCKVVNKTSVL